MPSPNILLIIMDSVRARNTSLHGSRHDTTPFLSDLSSTATLYTQARAPSQWSLPSHVSIFTGAHVPEHGVTTDGTGIEPGSTVFDDLQKLGYETGVFSENPYLTSLGTGLESGFDTVEGSARDLLFDGVKPGQYKGEPLAFLGAAVRSGKPFRSMANGLLSKVAWDYPALIPERFERRVAPGVVHGSTYTDLLCEFVERASEPWAACINYMDAHHPYKPASEFNRWDDGSLSSVHESLDPVPMNFYAGDDPWWKCEVLEYLYDGTIRQIDHEVRRVVEFLRERDAFDETMIIVTSDHGEAFGERSTVRGFNLAGHNVGENEVNLHVPLLIKYGGQREPEVVDELTTLTAIPDAIRRTIDGETGPFPLDDRSVVARTTGLRDVQLEQLRERGLDRDGFYDPADVLYERGDEGVTKRIVWNDRVATVKCIDSRTSYEVDSDGRGRVGTVFARFEDAGIRRREDQGEVSEAVERRLEDLGYR